MPKAKTPSPTPAPRAVTPKGQEEPITLFVAKDVAVAKDVEKLAGKLEDVKITGAVPMLAEVQKNYKRF